MLSLNQDRRDIASICGRTKSSVGFVSSLYGSYSVNPLLDNTLLTSVLSTKLSMSLSSRMNIPFFANSASSSLATVAAPLSAHMYGSLTTSCTASTNLIAVFLFMFMVT